MKPVLVLLAAAGLAGSVQAQPGRAPAGAGPDLRTLVRQVPPPAAESPRQLSAEERAQLRRQISEYARPTSTPAEKPRR